MKNLWSKRNIIIIVFVIAFSCLLLQTALASTSTNFRDGAHQQLSAAAGQQGADFGTPEDPRLIAAYVIRILLSFVGVVFVAYLVYGAYLWMTSAGEEDKVSKGRRIVTNAAIGTLIVLSAYSITLFVTRYMGIYNGPTGAFYGSYDLQIDSDTGRYFNTDPLAAPPNPYPAWGTTFDENNSGGFDCQGTACYDGDGKTW
jgi:hypothetical protein